MENTNQQTSNVDGDDKAQASTVFGTDRSWNDPQALFEFKAPNSAKTGVSKLNKRIGFPSDSTPSNSSIKPDSSNLSDAGAKSAALGINVPPPPPPLISKSIPNKVVHHQEIEPQNTNENPASPEEQINIEEVIKNLTETVQRAESAGKFDNKKATDISKRIKLFEEKWVKGQLNDKVQIGMSNLGKHLVMDEIQEAEKLQQRLNIEYPSLCTPWMVAIRQLILARKST